MKKLLAEFKSFINKGNALALAIGVIIGASFTAIVNAINTKIISPLIGLLLGDNNLNESLITVLKTAEDPETGEIVITNAIYWGAFLQTIIDFLLTAIILFVIFKVASRVSDTVKKVHDKELRVEFKLEKGLKLTKKEKALALKMAKDKEEKARKEAEEKAKIPEPTFEEKQLALLQGIYDSLNNQTTSKSKTKKEQ